MLTYTSRRNLFGDLTANDSATNLTLGDTLMNESERRILAKRNWPFLTVTDASTTTTASTQFYDLPPDFGKLDSIYVTSGSTQYVPKQSPTVQHWDRLNSGTNQEATGPEWYIILNNQIGFWPTPSTSSLTITFTYKKKLKIPTVADYTTGNVSALTNGAAVITGNSTTWTAPMVGRYIKMSASDTAGGSGDELWYKILSRASDTSITLDKNYQGTTISANTSYIIGDVGLIPEEFQILPVFEACETYYTSVMPNPTRAQLYANRKKELESDLVAAFSDFSNDPVIRNENEVAINQNLFVSL